MSLKILKLRPQLPEKLKGTIVERWINYWETLGRDYKEVAKDSIKFMKANPVKSSIYGSIGLFSSVSYKTNPTFEHFIDRVRASQNIIGLVYTEQQNPNSIRYLRNIEQWKNEERIRLTSLWLFSIVWIHDNGQHLSTTNAKCEYLQPQYSTFYDRIIDFGFMGKWWNLEKQMKDYDVNV